MSYSDNKPPLITNVRICCSDCCSLCITHRSTSLVHKVASLLPVHTVGIGFVLDLAFENQEVPDLWSLVINYKSTSWQIFCLLSLRTVFRLKEKKQLCEDVTWMVKVVLALESLGLLLWGQDLVEAVLADDGHLPLAMVHLILPQQLHDLGTHC